MSPSVIRYLKECCNGRMAKWLDARHPYWATARRERPRTALHAVAAMDATAATAATGRTRPHPTLLRRVVVAGAAAAGPEAPQGHAGRQPVPPWSTRLPKCWHSRRCG